MTFKIVTAIVVLLILAQLALKFWKKNKQAKNPVTTTTEPDVEVAAVEKSIAPELVTVEPEIASADEPTQEIEQTSAVESAPLVTTINITSVESPVANSHIPQDSLLKRHYLSHLQAMITSLHAPVTDALVASELARCLADEQAVQQLIGDYEKHKKTLSATVEPQTASPQESQENTVINTPVVKNESAVKSCNTCKLPEDSMLRRHYLTHLYTLAAANLPPCPTDSMLRRHYQNLLDAELKKLLVENDNAAIL